LQEELGIVFLGRTLSYPLTFAVILDSTLFPLAKIDSLLGKRRVAALPQQRSYPFGNPNKH